MGQSPVKNYLHIIFSTKYRQEIIHPPIETELHAYLGGICKKMDCQPLMLNMMRDVCGIGKCIIILIKCVYMSP